MAARSPPLPPLPTTQARQLAWLVRVLQEVELRCRLCGVEGSLDELPHPKCSGCGWCIAGEGAATHYQCDLGDCARAECWDTIEGLQRHRVLEHRCHACGLSSVDCAAAARVCDACDACNAAFEHKQCPICKVCLLGERTHMREVHGSIIQLKQVVAAPLVEHVVATHTGGAVGDPKTVACALAAVCAAQTTARENVGRETAATQKHAKMM